jgi:hypothetical protein
MQLDDGTRNGAKGAMPRLVLTPWVKEVPFDFVCSQCGQTFAFPEDRTPKEGAAVLWAAFRVHVLEKHREAAESAKGTGDD